MSVNPNVNEAGWFYHAPARRRVNEPVLYPPMSQVPGLAEDYGPPEDLPRPLFRDTDTKYIRLAKQGGRANLLQMKENSSDKREPVYYPRNEWFYLEDNAMDDAAEKKKNEIEYDFLRPEYMVHEPYKSEGVRFDRPARGPIGYDKMSVFEREPGQMATDKTVKLPNVLKPGYGVRSGKPLRLPKNKPPTSAQTDPGKGPRPLKYLPLQEKQETQKKKPSTETNDKPRISKLLGYAYEREWQDELKQWQDKQDIGRNRNKQMTHVPNNMNDPKIISEYTVNYGKQSAVIHSDLNRPHDTQQSCRPSEGKQGFTVRQNEAQRLREAKLQKQPEKDPFKMTRFKNIPARIDSQRHPTQQAVA